MESGSQYKSSNEQQRFAKQLDRDLARSSGRLSQSVIRKLISNDTSQWAKAIYDQKLAQNSTANNSLQQSSSPHATTHTSDSGISASGDTQMSNDGQAAAKTDTDLPPAPNDNLLYVLTVKNGNLAWTATQDC